jgi:hypothetical protein
MLSPSMVMPDFLEVDDSSGDAVEKANRMSPMNASASCSAAIMMRPHLPSSVSLCPFPLATRQHPLQRTTWGGLVDGAVAQPHAHPVHPLRPDVACLVWVVVPPPARWENLGSRYVAACGQVPTRFSSWFLSRSQCVCQRHRLWTLRLTVL